MKAEQLKVGDIIRLISDKWSIWENAELLIDRIDNKYIHNKCIYSPNNTLINVTGLDKMELLNEFGFKLVNQSKKNHLPRWF